MRLFLVLLFSSLNSYASYYETCTITAEVLKVEKAEKLFKVEIKPMKMTLQKGSHGDMKCKQAMNDNKSVVIELEKSPSLGSVNLIYTYYDSMGPKGLIQSSSWKLK